MVEKKFSGHFENFHTTPRPIHVHQDLNPGHFDGTTTPSPIVSSLPPRKHFPHLIHETVYSTTTTRIPTIQTTRYQQPRPRNIYDAISSLPQVTGPNTYKRGIQIRPRLMRTYLNSKNMMNYPATCPA